MKVERRPSEARGLRDVMVPMRDGVRLATDVYLPEGPGPWPALLERTPYDKTAPRTNEYTRAHPEVFGRTELAGFFVAEGFAVVFQDCRGRYGSEGRFTKYRGEAEDGYDTLAWIEVQPWCDGRIGTMGMSYSAHTQMAAAALNPPGLAAMVVDCGGFSNAYQGGIRMGGAFELKQVTWAYRHALRSRAAAADPLAKRALETVDIAEWFTRMPWKRGHSPLAAIPDYEDYLFEQWERTTFDAYWQVPALHAAGHHAAMPKVPSVHISGWYDPYARTAVENFTGLSALGHPAQLVLGPWTHGARSATHAGDVDFGPAATFDGAIGEDFVAWRLAFFARHLQGASVPEEPPVRVFVMGGGSGRRTDEGRLDHGGAWLATTRWPPEEARAVRLHLHADGSIADVPPAASGALSYWADPDRPVPTIGGPITSGEPVMRGGAFDQREAPGLFGCHPPFLPLSSRPDVLVFETPPLEKEVTIAGDVAVVLCISSDRPTTDFTAKLVDVHPPSEEYPQGFAMNLCDGILRASFRNGFERAEALVPGEAAGIRIELYPTANRFMPGHRIRVEIASSNFPRFDVNPNFAVDEDLAVARVKALNTLHFGPRCAAYLQVYRLDGLAE
jgi:uncharacterized protein